jgi:hypothetical protein
MATDPPRPILRRVCLRSGWLYVVQYPGLAEHNILIYKVGRTSNLGRRMHAYPTGTTLLFSVCTSDMRRGEAVLLASLQHCDDVVFQLNSGRECFKGPLQTIVDRVIAAATLFPPTQRTNLRPHDACTWFFQEHPGEAASILQDPPGRRCLAMLHQFLLQHDCITLVSMPDLLAHAHALRPPALPAQPQLAQEPVQDPVPRRGPPTDRLSGTREARILARVLCPSLRRLPSSSHNPSELRDIAQVPLVQQTLDALGILSPFDDVTVIHDLMAVFNSSLIRTDMFANYNVNCRLFHASQAGINDEGWALNKVAKAINMIIASAGLALEGTSTRKGNGPTRIMHTTHRLASSRVHEMLQLVRLPLSALLPNNEHARHALAATPVALDATPFPPVVIFFGGS